MPVPDALILSGSAVMPEKDPFNYTIITYGWVFMLSMWGGVVSFFQKVKDGKTRASNIMEFFGELSTSAFVGLATFYLCEYSSLDRLLTAVFVAVSGHMGTKAVYLLEMFAEKVAKRRMGM